MSGRRNRWVSTAVWVALVAALVVVLVFSVAKGDGPVTARQRAAQIESDLKCPSCEAISVLDSSASTAAAVRQVVLTRVRAGQSNEQIERYLVSRYGPSILLSPPTTGITALVWVVPVVAAAGGLGGLGLFFWRRRRSPPLPVTTEDRELVDRALVDRARADRDDGVAVAAPPGP